MKNKLRMKNRLCEIATGLAVIGGTIMLAAPSFAAEASVDLTATNQFEPAALTVGTGDKVTYSWKGGFHDVVFADGVSSGAPVNVVGTTFSRTFDTAGTYSYICSLHESIGMTGTVTVQAAATATTAAATTTTAPRGGTAATTTTAPSGGTAATTTTAPSGGTSPVVSQPFTGPEDSMLPIAGMALVLGGLGIWLRLRRTS